LSDKIIKAKNVKLMDTPAGTQVQYLSGNGELRESGVSPKGSELFSHAGEPGRFSEGIANVKKEAYGKGFSDGIESRKKEIVQILNAMVEVTRETAELKKKLYTEAEEQMLHLVFSIAEKVIHTEVSTNRKIVLEVLREAAKSVVDRDSIKIHLNPDDLRFIMEIKPDLFQEIHWLKNAAFEEDASIKPGGVLLETLSGEVDARLEMQLKEIKSSFKIP
jgi:flagellar assembly protein FliH